MPKNVPCPASIRVVAVATACALLAACGGGGGGAAPVSSTPPPPPPPPAPPPPPPQATNFDTAEFRRSDGPEFHNAVSAWQDGITGDGSVIAIIDTGIDQDSPEFAGRIHANSTDVVSNRGFNAEDDHGTNVALVAAAARDDTGVLGIAWDAQVLAIRADDPGSCGVDTPQDASLGCQFDDTNIAAGIDLAIASGANVINISLGGGAASTVLTDAVTRAAAAGVVVVVSAGNGGEGSELGFDPSQPDPFATSLLNAGNGNVIIVGSVDENGVISSFANRAGDDAEFYLNARGEGICCVYDNGEIFVETINGQQFVTLFSGTSFSAPQVAGAVALLAQAFPNLTGQEIVEILLDSARDAGAVGTDTIYGRGILDIAAAIAPSGTTTLAGTGQTLALADNFAIGSSAMGDATSGQTVSAIILDKYQRAYSFNLSSNSRGAAISQRLLGAVGGGQRTLNGSADSLALSFTVADNRDGQSTGFARELRLSEEDAQKSEVLAARVAARIAPSTKIGLGYAQSANGLVAFLQDDTGRIARPAFKIASGANSGNGFFQQSDLSLALRHQAGPWGLSFFAEEGEALIGSQLRLDSPIGAAPETRRVHSFGVAADRQIAGFDSNLGLTWMDEEETVLGAWFHEALGTHGANSLFADVSLRRELGSKWQFGASYRQGLTMARQSQVIAGGSNLWSNAWSLDLARADAFTKGDILGLRVSQPLRVTGGGLQLNLPVAYDYATETPEFGLRQLSLAPEGRELMGELAWRGPFLWGYGSASLFYRREPGHYASGPSDMGALVSFNTSF